MGRFKGVGRITTSITISPEFFYLAKKHNISFTDAARAGLAMKFADIGVQEYDNKMNLYRKMQGFQKKTEELTRELEEIKKKNG